MKRQVLRHFLPKFLLTALLFPTVLIQAQSAPKSQPALSVRVVSRAMVYAHPSADPYDPNNRYGFNHAPSVVLLPDSRLMATWFSGPYEASVNQLILASYSSDQGKTWSAAEIFQDFPRKSDFDPAFIADGKRTWFFFSAGRWNRWPAVKEESKLVGMDSYSTYFRYSDDAGRTWSSPEAATEKHFCRSNGIKLSTGELLLPIYETIDGNDRSGVLKSTDDGKSWKAIGGIGTDADADEPTIAELNSGAVMMILRTHDGFIWRTLSHDKGNSWSTPEKLDIAAANTSHNLFHLKDGRLLLTNNESRHRRTPLTLRVSADEGNTWSDAFKLTEVTIPPEGDPIWDRQVSYPSVAQLADGSVIVVWSEIILGDDEQYGDIRSARVSVQ